MQVAKTLILSINLSKKIYFTFLLKKLELSVSYLIFNICILTEGKDRYHNFFTLAINFWPGFFYFI